MLTNAFDLITTEISLILRYYVSNESKYYENFSMINIKGNKS